MNARVHDALEALWLEAMEAATLLDLEAARSAWDAFTGALAVHAALEDAEVLTIYEAHGTFPRGASLDIMTAEHAKLDALAANGREALDEVTDRRSMIRLLPRLMRPQQLLEHHTIREQTLVYPTLKTLCNSLELQQIRAALEKSLPD